MVRFDRVYSILYNVYIKYRNIYKLEFIGYENHANYLYNHLINLI